MQPESEQPWFGVRSVFRMERLDEGRPVRLFEERVVIFRARSGEEALVKGRVEAQRYAATETRPIQLDYVIAFALYEETLREGEEVWSCLREHNLSDEAFLKRMYGVERLGLRHFE